MLLIGLLVVSVALLSGCEILDNITGGITGGGTGGTETVVSGSMAFNFRATVSLPPNFAHPVRTSERFVGVDFSSGGGNYTSVARKFIATSWNGGDFSNTYFEARLNAAKDMIEYFYARQTQANVWFAWTHVYEIRGYNVPFSHAEGSSRIFSVTGANAHVNVDLLIYKGWSLPGESASNPSEWINSDAAIIPNIDNVITIQLDY